METIQKKQREVSDLERCTDSRMTDSWICFYKGRLWDITNYISYCLYK